MSLLVLFNYTAGGGPAPPKLELRLGILSTLLFALLPTLLMPII